MFRVIVKSILSNMTIPGEDGFGNLVDIITEGIARVRKGVFLMIHSLRFLWLMVSSLSQG